MLYEVITALIVAVIFWIIGTVARGGLVTAVDDIESAGKSGFRQAWSAGWQKKGTLIGIAIFPAIPGFILLILGLFALTAYGGFFAALGRITSYNVCYTKLLRPWLNPRLIRASSWMKVYQWPGCCTKRLNVE